MYDLQLGKEFVMGQRARFWSPIVLVLLVGGLCSGAARASSPQANAAGIAAGVTHACAVTDTGSAKCWGSNSRGELGDGSWVGHHIPSRVHGLADATAISSGNATTCALTSRGAARCWGDNFSYQVGDGTNVIRNTPVGVIGLGSGVKAISDGGSSKCALTSAGGVKCWGANCCGQLGDGTATERRAPVDAVGLASDVTAVAANGGYTCAVTSAGGVKCWGDNSHGQLGDGTTEERRTPVDVLGLTSGVAAIAVGGLHTCALTSAGGVKCWGYNIAGQLGDGTQEDRHGPVDVRTLSSGVVAIAAGFQHTCALLLAGAVRCWGYNAFGQLGDGSRIDSLAPVDVKGLTSVAELAANSQYTCARTTAGEVECWGGNESGQLGDGTTRQRSLPVPVVGFGGSLPPGRCVVPKVVGKRIVRAKAMIWRAHCRVGSVVRVRSARARNIVVRQSPRSGKRLQAGGKVNLFASRGA